MVSYSVYNQHKGVFKLLKTLFSQMHTSAGWIWQQKQWFVMTSHISNQEFSIIDHLIIRTFFIINIFRHLTIESYGVHVLLFQV